MHPFAQFYCYLSYDELWQPREERELGIHVYRFYLSLDNLCCQNNNFAYYYSNIASDRCLLYFCATVAQSKMKRKKINIKLNG